MIETVNDYNSFWLIVSIAIVVISICSIVGVVIVKLKNKDTDIALKHDENHKEIFFKHTDEHIDTTSKMKSMHDNVVKVDFTSSHEHELDEIEQTIDNHTTQLEQLTLKVEQVDVKVDELLNQFIALRKENKI